MRVEASVQIGAAPDQVFQFIAAPENGPRWQEGAVATRVTTPGPVRIGSRMVHEGRWLGLRIPTEAVVTICEPDRRFGYEIASRFGPATTRYELDPVAGGTRLTLSNESRLGWPLRAAGLLLRRSVQGMFERDVQRLKAVIESESPNAPAMEGA